MGRCYNLDIEITSHIPIDKLFKAFISDYETLIPTTAPHIVHSIENLQGDGGVGSIRKINFAPGQKYTYAKVKVVILEKEKFFLKFVVIEGDVLGGGILKIEVEIKIEISPEKKSILKLEFSYYTTDDIQLSNEQLEAVNNNSLALCKAVEDYFYEHPNA